MSDFAFFKSAISACNLSIKACKLFFSSSHFFSNAIPAFLASSNSTIALLRSAFANSISAFALLISGAQSILMVSTLGNPEFFSDANRIKRARSSFQAFSFNTISASFFLICASISLWAFLHFSASCFQRAIRSVHSFCAFCASCCKVIICLSFSSNSNFHFFFSASKAMADSFLASSLMVVVSFLVSKMVSRSTFTILICWVSR